MAHIIVMDFENADASQYDAVMVDMALGDRLPPHALIHGAGTPDGTNWRVVDVWETLEAFERFAAEQIGPITARHGIDPPRLIAFEATEVRRGAEAPVTFQHVVRLPGVDGTRFAELAERTGEPSEGLLLHANGALDGGWATIGFWTSKEARDAFVRDRVLPVLAGTGIDPVIEDLPLHNSLTQVAVAA